jgi:hypothetical protein
MFILISAIVIAVVAIIAYRIVVGSNNSDQISLSESKIVKKFNRLVRSINERNINTVKDELLEVIEEYKAVKVNQFIDSKNQISSSKRIINEEIANSELSRANVKKQIVKLKNTTNPDVANGASLVYQYERISDMINRMEEIKNSLEEKDAHLEREIETFNAKYAMKKAEVSMMIAQAISIKNVSNIDLRLNDLVTEFKTKAEEQENANYVKNKVYHLEKDSDEPVDIDAYKQKFLDFDEK